MNAPCVRCGENNEMPLGRTSVIPFTIPNRLFNPDIYCLEITHIACKKCTDDLIERTKEWWKEGRKK